MVVFHKFHLVHSWILCPKCYCKTGLFSITSKKIRIKKTLDFFRFFTDKDFFCKYDQICRKLRIWSYLLKKFLMENFIFCSVIGKLCYKWSAEGVYCLSNIRVNFSSYAYVNSEVYLEIFSKPQIVLVIWLLRWYFNNLVSVKKTTLWSPRKKPLLEASNRSKHWLYWQSPVLKKLVWIGWSAWLIIKQKLISRISQNLLIETTESSHSVL